MVMIVAHRGARNLWPENSLSGFRRLLALPVDAVEFDVHETRDQEFVVIHDPTLERTTFGSGAVRDLTAATVRAARLRDGPVEPPDPGEGVPSLDSVFETLAPSRLGLQVEIKSDATGTVRPDSIARLVALVHRHGLGKRTTLTCFVPEVLEQVRAVWPEASILASLDHRSAEMLGGIDRALARYATLDGCLVAVEKKLLACTLDRCLAVLGTDRIGAWVPNEPDEIAHWLAQPIRQITTDRPDRAVAIRAGRK